MQNSPSLDINQLDTIPTPSESIFVKIFILFLPVCFFLLGDNNNSTNEGYDKNISTGTNGPSSSITSTEASNRLALNAITNAIDKHMKPTIIAVNSKRKQIDRPYGESVTSVDAYVKIQNKENNRKRKSTKENNTTNDKTKAKQTNGWVFLLLLS